MRAKKCIEEEEEQEEEEVSRYVCTYVPSRRRIRIRLPESWHRWVVKVILVPILLHERLQLLLPALELLLHPALSMRNAKWIHTNTHTHTVSQYRCTHRVAFAFTHARMYTDHHVDMPLQCIARTSRHHTLSVQRTAPSYPSSDASSVVMRRRRTHTHDEWMSEKKQSNTQREDMQHIYISTMLRQSPFSRMMTKRLLTRV